MAQIETSSYRGPDRRKSPDGSLAIGKRRSDLLSMIRDGLQQVVDAIPHDATANVLSSPVMGDRTTAIKRRATSRRAQQPYRPRVVYRVTKKVAPKRNPLPETESKVYAFIARKGQTSARLIQEHLQLRDGQLWGAIRRLTLAGFLTSKTAQ